MYYDYMSEYSESSSTFSPEKPIQHLNEDRYGRNEYVRNLAQGLDRFPGSDSLVVGIQGSWGSGKTSLKNMLIEQLEQLAEIPYIEQNKYK